MAKLDEVQNESNFSADKWFLIKEKCRASLKLSLWKDLSEKSIFRMNS